MQLDAFQSERNNAFDLTVNILHIRVQCTKPDKFRMPAAFLCDEVVQLRNRLCVHCHGIDDKHLDRAFFCDLTKLVRNTAARHRNVIKFTDPLYRSQH